MDNKIDKIIKIGMIFLIGIIIGYTWAWIALS
jgi:hypothetical protein